MRKIIFFMTLSLDGYFEGKNHDISWHNVDEEFNKFAIEQLKETDLLLFGRRTYQLMESFWPRAADDLTTSKQDLEVAHLMNNTEKIIFSRTLDKVEERENWKNVRLVRKLDPEEIRCLKEQPGSKILSLGGSELALSFIQAGLIDEFRFMINPIILGDGTTIFRGIGGKLNLQLIKTRTFRSGNVLLYYKSSEDKLVDSTS